MIGIDESQLVGEARPLEGVEALEGELAVDV